MIREIRGIAGDVPVVISCITVAELGLGIYRAQTELRKLERRHFLDELKRQIRIHPVTELTAEIVARVGGEQAALGINLPMADMTIGACALQLDYAIATNNLRDFRHIPGLSLIQM